MREIISLNVGKAGNQIASNFWECLCVEHGLEPNGIVKEENYGLLLHEHNNVAQTEVFFYEAPGDRYVPRSVLIDLEPSLTDTIRASHGSLFSPDNFITGKGGASNIYSKGYYTAGHEILEQCLDTLRAEAEACDCLQGFHFLHALGGGTGSGLGGLLLEKIKEEYPDRILSTYSIVPSEKISDVVVEPYNANLAFNKLIEYSDQCLTLDNEGLYNICCQQLKITEPTFGDMNTLIAKTMCGTTSSLRFPGQLNCDLRKMATNLIPFPRLHFLSASYAPIVSPSETHMRKATINLLLHQALDYRFQIAAADNRKGQYLTMACFVRGTASSLELEEEVAKKSKSSEFVEWVPDSFKTCLCSTPSQDSKLSLTCVGNTTSIAHVMRRIGDQFDVMFKRKAYLHSFTSEGLEEAEMEEARFNMKDLIAEYQQLEDRGGDDHDEYKDGEVKDGDDDDDNY